MARTAVVLLFFSAFFSRCASMLSPTGGPRDSLPPVIIAMTPDNYTTNFDAKEIYIEFDEFVQIKDQQKEFFTSPAMKKKPTLLTRKRGVVVTIKDTLLENTTYALNFGSSIRDNNEGNPLNAMRFVFSTGPEIDSMIVSGYTEDSYKADSVSKSYLYFFPVDSIETVKEYDSTLFKYSPAVIARAENNGIFIAQNLKPISYRVYAIEDTNDNQMYEPATDQVGFLDYDVNPLEQPGFAIWFDSLRMYPTADPQLYFRMFTDVTFKRQILQGSDRPLQHKATLYFGASNPQIESIGFDSILRDRVMIEQVTKGRDTIALWFNAPAEEIPDTIRTYVSYFKHDSINNLVLQQDTLKLSWRLFETKDQEKEREKLEKERDATIAAGLEWVDPTPNPFKHNLSLSGELNPEKIISVDFTYPLTKLDTLAFDFQKIDADSVVTAQKFSFERDTSNIRRYHLRTEWGTLGDKFSLTIPAGAIEDIAGFSNDTIVANYSLLDPEKFATVVINLESSAPAETKYIIQLLNGSSKLIEEKCDQVAGKVQFNYVPAGDIRLRIIEDRNGNGVWDSGNVVERRQSERSEIFSQDGESTFTTKVNWEMEFTMDMDKIFAPITMESLIKLLDERETQRLEKERIRKAEEEMKKSSQGNSSGGMGGFGGMSSLTNMGGL